MEMDGKKITTTDEARQAIVDLYVEGIEKEGEWEKGKRIKWL